MRQKQHLTAAWCDGVTSWRESIAVVVGAGLSLPTSQAAQFEQVPVRRRTAGEQLPPLHSRMSSVKTYSVTRIYHKSKPRHAEARAVLYVYQMSVPPGNLFSMAVSGEGRIKMLPHPNISGARVTHVGVFGLCPLNPYSRWQVTLGSALPQTYRVSPYFEDYASANFWRTSRIKLCLT